MFRQSVVYLLVNVHEMQQRLHFSTEMWSSLTFLVHAFCLKTDVIYYNTTFCLKLILKVCIQYLKD